MIQILAGIKSRQEKGKISREHRQNTKNNAAFSYFTILRVRAPAMCTPKPSRTSSITEHRNLNWKRTIRNSTFIYIILETERVIIQDGNNNKLLSCKNCATIPLCADKTRGQFKSSSLHLHPSKVMNYSKPLNSFCYLYAAKRIQKSA